MRVCRVMTRVMPMPSAACLLAVYLNLQFVEYRVPLSFLPRNNDALFLNKHFISFCFIFQKRHIIYYRNIEKRSERTD